MRQILVLGSVLSFQAHAAKMIWVYVPGSDITWTYGINDKNVVAGTYYVSDRTVHAFFGPPGGSYKDFRFAGATPVRVPSTTRATSLASRTSSMARNTAIMCRSSARRTERSRKSATGRRRWVASCKA